MRRAARLEPHGELMLAAMVDMMVNVLLFILMLYGTGPVEWAGPVELAPSTSKAEVENQVAMAVSLTAVAVDGARVLDLAVGAAGPTPPGEEDLERLRDWLVERRASAGEAAPLAVQVDRRVPWTVLRPLLGVVGEAGYQDVRFFAARGER